MKRCYLSLIVALLLFIPFDCMAACSGSGLSWTCSADSTASQINSAVSSATAGATITVGAGSGTWSSSVNLTKRINLIGAGSSSTTITCSASPCISGEVNSFRVSGFRFNGSNDFIWVWGVTGWRIDNNYFYSASTFCRAVMATSATNAVHPSGLIDSNTMYNATVLVCGTSAMLGEGNYQHQLWSQNISFGDVNAVYIENNTISSSVFGNAIDCNYAGRYVFRFNTVTDYYLEAHSVQGENRACRRWEIHNNSIINPTWTAVFPRGGSGFVFNNTISGTGSNYIQINNVRSCRDPGEANGKCAGSSNWDQNSTGMQGYACRDQIGRAGDTTTWSVGAAYSQPLTPAYFWGNAKSGSQTSVIVDAGESCSPSDLNATHIQANRDYYVYNASFNGTTGVGVGTLGSRPATCTTSSESGGGVGYWATDQNKLYRCSATNTWTEHYTPYTCPHPLTGLTGTCDSTKAGAGLAGGYNVGGSYSWGAIASATETNKLTFTDKWTCSAGCYFAGSDEDDTEKIMLAGGAYAYLTNCVPATATAGVTLKKDQYDSGGTYKLYYRTAATQALCEGDGAWTEYTTKFTSSGWVRLCVAKSDVCPSSW